MQVKNPARQDFSMKTIIETIKFWEEKGMDYKNAGVDIEAGYKSVELMKQHIAKTMRPEVLGGIGGFSGAFSMNSFKDMEEPTLVSGTDGVGTKLKLAFIMDKHDTVGICNTDHFSQAALSAVTYDQKLIGYPVYFDTSALVYNEDYLRTWATQQAEKELAGSSENDEPIGEGEEIIEEDSLPEDQTTEQVTADEAAVNALAEQYFAEALPSTVDDLLNIADTFDAPEGVEGVMKWDVNNIFYNYWIVGNYMIVGGDPGDDRNDIDINNPETIQCLEVYKALNQFFFIESDTVTYDSVIQDFIDGKTMFTIGTTDVVKRLEEAKADDVLILEPYTKLLLTVVTVTVSAVLVIDVPYRNIFIAAIAFCKLCRKSLCVLLIYQGVWTEIVSGSKFMLASLVVGAHCLRIFFDHPCRQCCCGCCHDDVVVFV